MDAVATQPVSNPVRPFMLTPSDPVRSVGQDRRSVALLSLARRTRALMSTSKNTTAGGVCCATLLRVLVCYSLQKFCRECYRQTWTQ